MERIGQGNTAEVFALDGDKILKLFRPGVSRGTCAREYAAVTAAAGVYPNVPRVYEMREVEGRPGIVYERVDGFTLLEEMLARPWRVFAAAKRLAGLHAGLHRPVQQNAALPDARLRICGFIEGATVWTPRQKEFLLRYVMGLPEGTMLCHNDFHPGNVICAAGRDVVIDWPNACRGVPESDFARSRMVLKYSHMQEAAPAKRLLMRCFAGLLRALYSRAYHRQTGCTMAEVRRWEHAVMAARVGEDIPAAERAVIHTAVLRWLAKACAEQDG